MLAGIRVLRLGDCASAGFCAQMMARMGAEVRALPDDGQAAVRFAGSAFEAAWYGLDDKIPAASPAQAYDALLADCDVLIDARRPGAAQDTALTAERLRQVHPHLVHCRISAFGDDGPYRDHHATDITLYAMSGLMQATGDGNREPLNARPRIAQVSAGLYAYIGCLMALRRRMDDGRGDGVEVSMQEAAMQNAEIALAEHLRTGKVARRNNDEHALVPWRTYPCADGAVFVCGGPARNWWRVVDAIGDPALGASPFGSMAERLQNRAAFEAQLRPSLADHDKWSLFHMGQRCGLSWAPLATLEEALDDPQLRDRRFFRETNTIDGRIFRQPDIPFRTLAGDVHAKTSPPPPTQAASDAPPLAGVRVVDFTHDWAGPHAARVLADYGAEVIKIEYPQRLDGMRGGFPEKVNDFARFWQLHRNKRSVTLDLARDDHLAVCKKLIADSDIVIENSRPGVMARLGLDFDELRTLREDIILISMSAFGASGPYAAYAGYGGGIEAASGLQSLTGYATEGASYRVREMDVINGIYGAAATMSALLHRQRGGGGQWIDLSETETCCWSIGEYFADCSGRGAAPEMLGNRHPVHAPQGCYPCAGEDRWITICAADDRQWQALAACIDAPQWAEEPRFADAAERRQHHDEIDARIAAWTQARDPMTAMQQLQTAGVAAGVVMNAADLASDPHLSARGWFLETQGVRLPGLPFRFLRDSGGLRHPGPALGRDNQWLAEHYGTLSPIETPRAETLGTAFDAER